MSRISMDLKTEERLIKTVQKGGPRGREAFGTIYTHYKPHLERFFVAHLGNSTETDDLISEVFKKALAGVDSFRWQDISLSAWLYKISKNVLIDYFRESSKRKSVSLEDIAPPVSKDASPEEAYFKTERDGLLHELLAELPERERKIIYLKFFEGQTNKSISRELKLSETNIGTIVYRSIRKLHTKVSRT